MKYFALGCCFGSVLTYSAAKLTVRCHVAIKIVMQSAQMKERCYIDQFLACPLPMLLKDVCWWVILTEAR